MLCAVLKLPHTDHHDLAWYLQIVVPGAGRLGIRSFGVSSEIELHAEELGRPCSYED